MVPVPLPPWSCYLHFWKKNSFYSPEPGCSATSLRIHLKESTIKEITETFWKLYLPVMTFSSSSPLITCKIIRYNFTFLFSIPSCSRFSQPFTCFVILSVSPLLLWLLLLTIYYPNPNQNLTLNLTISFYTPKHNFYSPRLNIIMIIY